VIPDKKEHSHGRNAEHAAARDGKHSKMIAESFHDMIRPEGFYIVEVACLFSEDMHDDIAVVKDYPPLLAYTLAMERFVRQV